MVLAAASTTFTGAAVPAAEPVRVVSAGFTFVLPETEIARGTPVELANVDPAPHNITSVVTGRSGSPLFWSDTIGAGEVTGVVGVDRLGPGVYDYVCTLHPSMLGTLFVTG